MKSECENHLKVESKNHWVAFKWKFFLGGNRMKIFFSLSLMSPLIWKRLVIFSSQCLWKLKQKLKHARFSSLLDLIPNFLFHSLTFSILNEKNKIMKKREKNGKSITKENRNCCTHSEREIKSKAKKNKNGQHHTMIFYGMEKLLIDWKSANNWWHSSLPYMNCVCVYVVGLRRREWKRWNKMK